MALAISKYIEIQADISIKRFIQEAKKITDGRLKNKITQKETRLRVSLNDKILAILQKLDLLT